MSIVSRSRYFRKVDVSRFRCGPECGVSRFDSVLINENFSVTNKTMRKVVQE